MLSFASGISYLRQEALASGFIIESDNDDKLVERLSQVVRKLGAGDAEKCDELTKPLIETPTVMAVAPVAEKEDERKADLPSGFLF